MKVLSLTQPFATLIALKQKTIETRSWATNYRGPLAIHAAKGYGKGGERAHKELCGTEPFCSVLNAAANRWLAKRGDLRDMVEHPFMPFGAIVAVCRLYDCLPTDRLFLGWRRWQYPGTDTAAQWEMTEQERAFGDYSLNRYGWLLADIRPLAEPIPARGALGLWNWEPPAKLNLALQFES